VKRWEKAKKTDGRKAIHLLTCKSVRKKLLEPSPPREKVFELFWVGLASEKE